MLLLSGKLLYVSSKSNVYCLIIAFNKRSSVLKNLRRFFLADTFGDHWDTANFFAYDSYTHYQKLTPDCAHDPLFHKYCFNPQTANDGDTVSATVIGFKPDNFWEV